MKNNNKKEKKKTGICKLTLQSGEFIRSHLIPQALTKPPQRGVPFFQLSSAGKIIKRWSSWYDTELVIQKGEDRLTELDTWAILELRKNKLVWSSWGSEKNLGEHHTLIGSSPYGIRKIETIDQQKLRLFLLSLLWRAAASEVPEFSQVQMPIEDIERLRTIILSGIAGDISFYPASLTQLSTVGPAHNQAPIFEIKTVNSLVVGMAAKKEPIYRFYFDGLMVHFHCQRSDNGETAAQGNLIVGAENSLILSTNTYENSYQRELLLNELKGYPFVEAQTKDQ